MTKFYSLQFAIRVRQWKCQSLSEWIHCHRQLWFELWISQMENVPGCWLRLSIAISTFEWELKGCAAWKSIMSSHGEIAFTLETVCSLIAIATRNLPYCSRMTLIIVQLKIAYDVPSVQVSIETTASISPLPARILY